MGCVGSKPTEPEAGSANGPGEGPVSPRSPPAIKIISEAVANQRRRTLGGSGPQQAPTEANRALHQHAEEGDIVKLDEQLSSGVEVDARLEGLTPLLRACKSGHVDIVTRLLELGADKRAQGPDGAGPLYVACESGHAGLVRLLVSRDPGMKDKEAKEAVGPKGRTPLYAACMNGHEAVVRLLLKELNTAAKEMVDKEGATPLWIAAQQGHAGVVRLLLDDETFVYKLVHKDTATKDGRTPLWVACAEGHLEVARMLVSLNANKEARVKEGLVARAKSALMGDATERLEDGATPLHVACERGRLEVVKLLLLEGSNTEALANGTTPLFAAAKAGRTDVVWELLQAGAKNDTPRGQDGASPLWIACAGNNVGIVEELLQAGAAMEATTKEGVSPLLVASQRGHEAIVHLLLASARLGPPAGSAAAAAAAAEQSGGGASSGKPMGASQVDLVHQKSSPLQQQQQPQASGKDHSSGGGGEQQAWRGLLEMADKAGVTPLHAAAAAAHLGTVQALVAAGANLEATAAGGSTPLIAACTNNHAKVARFLLSCGARVDVAGCKALLTQKKRLPLLVAAGSGTAGRELVHLLLEFGAAKSLPADIPKELKDYTVHLEAALELEQATRAAVAATRLGDRRALLDELHKFPNVPTKNIADRLDLKTGLAPLHATAERGGEDLLRILIEIKGVDVDVASHPDGHTPLHACVMRAREALCRMLLGAGAAVNSPCRDGSTALHLAVLLPAPTAEAMCRVLLEVPGVSVDALDGRQQTPLHLAANKGDTAVCRLLLEEGGAWPDNARARDHWTPLHAAAHAGHEDVATLLLKAQADVNAAAADGASPLVVALQGPRAAEAASALCRMLLGAGADPNQALTVSKITALHLVAARGLLAICRQLLDAAANPDAVTETGRTPLQEALGATNYDCAQALIKAGANLNGVDEQGNTLLHAAARMGDERAVRLLLAGGADASGVNSMGLKAARCADRPELERLLETHEQAQAGGGGLAAASSGVVESPSQRRARAVQQRRPHASRPDRLARQERLAAAAAARKAAGLGDDSSYSRVTEEAPPQPEGVAALEASEDSGADIYNKRFARLAYQLPMKGASGMVIMAADLHAASPGEATVALKVCADEQMRNRTLKALEELCDSRYVVTLADPKNWAACVFEVARLHPATPYAIAFQGGIQTLGDILADYKQNHRLSVIDATSYFVKVVEAVEYVHSRGWVHCDIKPANIVEFRGRCLKLIDLDHCSKPGKGKLQGTTPEACPPEVAALLALGHEADVAAAIDVWAMGCIFYQMLTGETLLRRLIPEADELDRGQIWQRMGGVSQQQLDALVEDVVGMSTKNVNARSLLTKMLQVDPRKRVPARELLQHKLFEGGITATHDIQVRRHEEVLIGIAAVKNEVAAAANTIAEKVADAVVDRVAEQLAERLAGRTHPLGDMGLVGQQLEEIRALVLRGHELTFQVAENTCPRTFVILPEVEFLTIRRQQAEQHQWQRQQQQEEKEAGQHDGSSGSGCGNSDAAAIDSSKKEKTKAMLLGWFRDVVDVFTAPGLQDAVDNFQWQRSASSFLERLTFERFRLFLLCEISGELQGDGYVITRPRETVTRLMPAMQIGFKLLSFANNALQLARVLLPPALIPEGIPESAMGSASDLMDALSAKSSVEDFACVRSAFEEAGCQDAAQRKEQAATSVRQFRAFLDDVDPGGNWAGLQRYLGPNGEVLWASLNAIQARTQAEAEAKADAEAKAAAEEAKAAEAEAKAKAAEAKAEAKVAVEAAEAKAAAQAAESARAAAAVEAAEAAAATISGALEGAESCSGAVSSGRGAVAHQVEDWTDEEELQEGSNAEGAAVEAGAVVVEQVAGGVEVMVSALATLASGAARAEAEAEVECADIADSDGHRRKGMGAAVVPYKTKAGPRE